MNDIRNKSQLSDYKYRGISNEALISILHQRDADIEILRSMLINLKLDRDKNYINIRDQYVVS